MDKYEKSLYRKYINLSVNHFFALKLYNGTKCFLLSELFKFSS